MQKTNYLDLEKRIQHYNNLFQQKLLFRMYRLFLFDTDKNVPNDRLRVSIHLLLKADGECPNHPISNCTDPTGRSPLLTSPVYTLTTHTVNGASTLPRDNASAFPALYSKQSFVVTKLRQLPT